MAKNDDSLTNFLFQTNADLDLTFPKTSTPRPQTPAASNCGIPFKRPYAAIAQNLQNTAKRQTPLSHYPSRVISNTNAMALHDATGSQLFRTDYLKFVAEKNNAKSSHGANIQSLLETNDAQLRPQNSLQASNAQISLKTVQSFSQEHFGTENVQHLSDQQNLPNQQGFDTAKQISHYDSQLANFILCSNQFKSQFEEISKENQQLKEQLKKAEEKRTTDSTRINELEEQLNKASNDQKEACAKQKDQELKLRHEFETKITALSKENDQLKKDNEKHLTDLACINELHVQLADRDAKLREKDELLGKLQTTIMLQDDDLETLRNTKKMPIDGLETDKLRKLAKSLGDKLVKSWEDRASDLVKHGDSKEACSHYSNAIETEKVMRNDPTKLANLYLLRARVHLSLKQYQQAIDDSTSVLQYRTDCIFSLTVRSKAYIAIKHYPSARVDLQKILELNPQDVEAARLLSSLNAKSR